MTPAEEFEGTWFWLITNWPCAITPYFFNLIDAGDENCPIRRQVVPRVEEAYTAPWEMSASVRRGRPFACAGPGASLSRPRVLFLVTDRLRGLLPLLHTLANGEQRDRLPISIQSSSVK